MSIKIYTPDIEKEIWEKIEQVEKRARTRLVDNYEVKQIIKALRETESGTAYADGGHVPSRYKYNAETTYVNVSWSTRRGIKFVTYNITRSYARKVNYGAYSSFKIDPDERKAFEIVFRDRVERARRYILKRALRAAGITDPPEKIIPVPERFRLIEKDPAGISLFVAAYEYILVTPLGVFVGVFEGSAKTEKMPKNVEDAFRHLGMGREAILDEREFARSVADFPPFGRWDVRASEISDCPIAPAIEERPYGVGVQINRSGSSDVFAWYTRAKVKKIVLEKSDFARIVPTPATPSIVVLDDRKMAWEMTFPERARKCRQLLIRRKLRSIGIPREKIPDGELEIRRIWPELRMAVVKNEDEPVLCTPIGTRALHRTGFKSAREAFREAFDFSLPKKRKIEWEEIEALIALHTM